ncbi:MAG: zinc ribbon domain-containing protein [Candidatus Sumerlaeaceae bacterium]|jgi:predicted nucleic-acid-binding Zn-ribbon protein
MSQSAGLCTKRSEGKAAMTFEEKLLSSFCCTKCRGKTAVARTVKLPGKFPPLLSFGSEEFVLLTCTLCGYTEMYSPLAFDKAEQPASETKPVPNES